MSVPLAFASQHMDFSVTLRGSPSVVIRVAGSEVNLFATKECEFAEVLPFPCAPDHWQDFVSVHLPGAGTGSSDNHALENELRAKGTAVEFHECCLKTGDTVTLVGELLRSANGELTLQPLSREVSWKRTSWERAGIGEEDILELLEEQMAQQQKLQKHLALRHTMAAKRNVDGLPELPLARWEEQPTLGPVGASPYPMVSPVTNLVAPVASSSPTY
ncbi:unnamed protein product [Durusdinium trenchii]|uniref:Uncharacterized protein n=1 Tax=Durusdinium trenchii TaxID=1381693 RepID=A0ABP0LAI7_9DINO